LREGPTLSINSVQGMELLFQKCRGEYLKKPGEKKNALKTCQFRGEKNSENHQAGLICWVHSLDNPSQLGLFMGGRRIKKKRKKGKNGI